ncbi:hypothetical protein K461DRAFT_155360 [Myriangium duriaei CBS 260.36]|uniref:F-box domain-containing protein n=1 Tax=Myriangium duriaei CBS 260.36 TaxID=1168546 RepID=A0A9P4J1R5_9PEZI|nr:hypothetical protein K461DRAFT_155360 [Myriangium duriaei CBS 260.36]
MCRDQLQRRHDPYRTVPPTQSGGFTLIRGQTSDKLLVLLKERCPRLTKLWLLQLNDHKPRDLIALLIASKDLSFIHLGVKWVTTEVLCHVAGRKLQTLRAPRTMTTEVVKRIFEKVEQPFSQVEDLTISATSASMVQLLPHLGAVKSLDIQLQGSSTRCFRHFSSLQGLRDLEIEVMDDSVLDPQDLMELRNLKALQTFKIGGEAVLELTSVETAREVCTFFGAFPYLQEFTFNIVSNLGVQAIIALGKGSPLLEDCYMAADIPGLYLDTVEGTLFPRLKRLAIEGFCDPRDPDEFDSISNEIARVLHRHFPSMKDMNFMRLGSLELYIPQLLKNLSLKSGDGEEVD